MATYTQRVYVGNTCIGGGAPITIQSMTNTDTCDIEATLQQIYSLQDAGVDIVRISVYNEECAQALKTIKNHVNVPIVADIHFDYKLAIASVENGADKLRINPGNIGSMDRVRQVADCAKLHNVPIRIGVNSGSLSKEILKEFGGPTPEAVAQSALDLVSILEKCNFYDIVISAKHSNVRDTIASNQLLRRYTDYPLHIGVTEAGTHRMALIKSSIGVGSLLLDGIGDTIRISITGDPVREVYAAKDILKACGLMKEGVEVISCPTCGRCNTDIEKIALEVERRSAHIKPSIRVAVMGCIVNGPGEARESDIGIAGGKNEFLLFKGEEMLGKLPPEKAIDTLMDYIENIARSRQ